MSCGRPIPDTTLSRYRGSWAPQSFVRSFAKEISAEEADLRLFGDIEAAVGVSSAGRVFSAPSRERFFNSDWSHSVSSPMFSQVCQNDLAFDDHGGGQPLVSCAQFQFGGGDRRGFRLMRAAISVQNLLYPGQFNNDWEGIFGNNRE
jgi:hypothetical protein